MKKIKHHFTKIFKGKILTFLREDIPRSGDNYKQRSRKDDAQSINAQSINAQSPPYLSLVRNPSQRTKTSLGDEVVPGRESDLK